MMWTALQSINKGKSLHHQDLIPAIRSAIKNMPPDSSIQTSRIMGDTLGLTPSISSTLGEITSPEDEELLLGPTCDQSDLTTEEVNELLELHDESSMDSTIGIDKSAHTAHQLECLQIEEVRDPSIRERMSRLGLTSIPISMMRNWKFIEKQRRRRDAEKAKKKGGKGESM